MSFLTRGDTLSQPFLKSNQIKAAGYLSPVHDWGWGKWHPSLF